MKILCAFRIFLPVAAGLLLLSGCASAPEQPHYRPYTMTVYPPKPANYQIPILYERPSQDVEFIGRYTCFGTQSLSRSELMEAAQAKARRVGADAILVYTNDVVPDDSRHENSKMESRDPSERTESRGLNAARSGSSSEREISSFESSESASRPKYSLAFDVDMIVYKHAAR